MNHDDDDVDENDNENDGNDNNDECDDDDSNSKQDFRECLLTFNDDRVVTIAEDQVKSWRISDISQQLHIPFSMIASQFRSIISQPASKFGENTQFAARRRSIRPIDTSATIKNRNDHHDHHDNNNSNDTKTHSNNQHHQSSSDNIMINKRKDSIVIHKRCNESIISFLHKVITKSCQDDDIKLLEISLKRCLYALIDVNNRELLITMLKTAHHRYHLVQKKQQQEKNKFTIDDDLYTIYPLNPEAFEAFVRLFDGFLQICSDQLDYINAFGLLEVGGQYFRFLDDERRSDNNHIDHHHHHHNLHRSHVDEEDKHDDDRKKSYLEDDNDHANRDDVIGDANDDDDIGHGYIDDEYDMMEFISDRTCQHLIYHNSALWVEIIKSRLASSSSSSSSAAAAAAHDYRKVASRVVMNEVYQLLHIMRELEVSNVV
jgi:hypothetical protein